MSSIFHKKLQKKLGGMNLRCAAHRLRVPTRYCSFCGQEVAAGEAYWYINGATVCGDCLPDYARADYAPFRRVHGKEEAHAAI